MRWRLYMHIPQAECGYYQQGKRCGAKAVGLLNTKSVLNGPVPMCAVHIKRAAHPRDLWPKLTRWAGVA